MTNSKSLDAYRQIVGALDQMDRSAGVVSSLVDARTRYQVQESLAEIHRRLEQVRNAVEDVLYDDHGRLGFESDSGSHAPPDAGTGRRKPRPDADPASAELREKRREATRRWREANPQRARATEAKWRAARRDRSGLQGELCAPV
ncbi:MAG: hypothetical protein LAP87_15415 [Acidobacteriia bacterium]|nr:hypothetical protein [Terriglobia bacterium]